MHFSKEFIQTVKDATDLFDLVKEYAPDLKMVTNNIAQCRCPNPSHHDEHPSFVIKINEQIWNCFGCSDSDKTNKGEGSDCIAFMNWITQGEMNFQQSVIYLAKRANIPIPNDKNKPLYDKNYKEQKLYMQNLKNNYEALNYLYKRGLNDSDIKEFQIGYDVAFQRITFPLFDQSKNILGFSKREIKNNKNSKNKYWNSNTSEIFIKSKYLYGLHNINKKLKYIIITEGIFDVILANKFNIYNVVCTLGTAFTEEHIKMIKNYRLMPVLIFDNDEAGRKARDKIVENFDKHNIYCKVCILPEGQDLCETCLQCKSNIRQYIQQNTYTYAYFKAKQLIDFYNRNIYELKLKIQPNAEKIIQSVPLSEKKAIENFLYEELRIRI